MKSVLVITRLDYRREPHQRFHQQVQYWAPRVQRLTVLFRRWNTGRSIRELVRALFSFHCDVSREGGVQLVEVDPVWNLPRGFGVTYVGFLQDFIDVVSMFGAFVLRVREPYDVCVGVGPYGVMVGHLLKRWGLVSHLVYDDIDYEPGFYFNWRFRRWYHVKMEQYCLRRADVLVTVGQRLADLRRSQTEKVVHLIPNGVDYASFAAAQDKPPHPPTLIYTGNVARWHSGLDVAIEAMPAILRELPAARLIVIGSASPAEEADLRRRVVEHGLDEHVHLLGAKPYATLPQYLREADVGLAVFPPNEVRSYAVPCKVFEYMAAGLAVVATGGSESARIVADAECGEIIEHTRTDLARAIVGLFRRPDLLKRYAENAAHQSRACDWRVLMERELACIEASLATERSRSISSAATSGS
jgi:glycosyltransferase involved in cell wall biosynthesis